MVRIKGIYEYINNINQKVDNYNNIKYRLIDKKEYLFKGEGSIDKVFERLKKYNIVNEKTKDIIEKIHLASNWADDILIDEEKYDLTLEDNKKEAIHELVSYLEDYKEKNHDNSSNDIQTIIYEISKKYSIRPKDFFRLLYKILIHTDRGPKLGNYIVDIGISKACEIIKKYV